MNILNTEQGCMWSTTPISSKENNHLCHSIEIPDNELPIDFKADPSKYNYNNGVFTKRDRTQENIIRIKLEKKKKYQDYTDGMFFSLIENNLDTLPIAFQKAMKPWLDAKKEIRDNTV